jgi:predicted transcriptional regulator
MPSGFQTNKKERILELENRRNIYLIILKNPGCHFREIQRKSNFPHSTLRYHINYLTKHGLLLAKKQGQNIRYFSSNFQTSNIKLLSILRQKTLRDILIYIIQNPSCNQESISNFIKLSPSTTSHHLNKLISQEILSLRKSGRQTLYGLKSNKEEIIKLLITYKESFFDALVNKTLEMWDIT